MVSYYCGWMVSDMYFLPNPASPGAEKNTSQDQRHSPSTLLAHTGFVPRGSVDVSPSSSQDAPLPRTPDAGWGRVKHPKLGLPHLMAWCFHGRQKLSMLALSPIQAILTQSRKDWGRTSNSVKWKRFSIWVQHNQSYSVTSSILVVLDYLWSLKVWSFDRLIMSAP